MTENRHIDRSNQRMLSELAQDGRLSVTKLARRIGLSKSPTQVRLRRLQAAGNILDFRAVVDMAALAATTSPLSR